MWLTYHDYAASLGLQNGNIEAIMSEIGVEASHHDIFTLIGRRLLRYPAAYFQMPLEMQFQVLSRMTWLEWPMIAHNVLVNLPRNERDEQRECEFLVRDETRAKTLGKGAIKLLVSKPLETA